MQSHLPRVTVGLPVFNGARYLPRTLQSILSQSFKDFELIVSDNASTDETEDICRTHARGDRRVRYVRHSENRGAAWNHNCLIELAEGSFFKWAGADDLYEPEFLSFCLKELDSDPDAVLAYPRTVAIDECGAKLYEYSPGWELLSDSPCERLRAVILKGGHWVNADPVGGVIRMDALRRTRLMPSYLGGDKRPLGELSLMGKFIEVPQYLLRRRFHPNSSGMRNPFAKGYDAIEVTWMVSFFHGTELTAYLPSWTLLRDHLSTVRTSTLPVAQKLRLTSAFLKACYWYKKIYIGELKNLRRFLYPRRRSTPLQ